MKDKIFIIWSGSDRAAQLVKRTLEQEHKYICIVGGSFESSKQMLTVGDTVIRQMISCNQAIVIFQNRHDGRVSSNLYFELGFACSEYGLKKIHCVKRKGEAITLPSDFDNSFVEEIEGDSDEAFAQGVVKYFIGRQKLSIDTNKMYLINNRHIMHEMIQAHYSEAGSKCSDYELAQYILFYMQAAVMFQDDARVLDELRTFKRLYNSEFSSELNEAVNISISLLEIQVGLKNDGDTVYIDDALFRKYFNSCRDILSEIKDDDSGTYDEWAKVIASENLAYACALYANDPNLRCQMRDQLLGRTIKYGKACLEYIDILEKTAPCQENNDSIGLISMFRAYTYRHLFNAAKVVQPDEAGKWITAALKERHALMCNFNDSAVDSKIFVNFEMEYYLSLIEYLDYFDKDEIDPFDYEMYISDIDSFIADCSKRDNTHAYIKMIASQRERIG